MKFQLRKMAYVSIVFLAAASFQVIAADESASRRAVVMPWQFFGIDAESKSLMAKDLDMIRKNFASDFLLPPGSNPPPKQKEKISLNNARAFEKLLIGESSQQNINESLSIEPSLCRMGDYLLTFLHISHLENDELLVSEHFAVKIQKDQQPSDPTKQMADAAKNLSKRALAQLANRSRAKENELRLNLRLRKQNTRNNLGSAQCLNLLLAESMLKKGYTIARFTGGETMHNHRMVSQTETKLMRPTRSLAVDWRYLPTNPKNEPVIPLQFMANIHYFEGVFGRRISKPVEVKYTFSYNIETQTIESVLDNDTQKVIDHAAKALASNELPQIAKIYGAWLYLDKGRAYGLKMNDRLVVSSDPNEVHGHVVGFYGPELAIKSPRGFDVHEGAIVFVRKGQAKTEIGQELAFDQTKYPTPWPPSPSNQ